MRKKCIEERNVMLVTFSGIDGSGKSSLVKSLKKHFSEIGITADYAYGRAIPIVSRIPIRIIPFIYKIINRKKHMVKGYNKYSETKYNIASSSIVQFIMIFSFSIDQILTYYLKVKNVLDKNDLVLLDRYYYDMIITDIYPNIKNHDIKMNTIINRLMCMFKLKKPDLAFLIDLPEDIAFGRKNDVPDLEFLSIRRYLFKQIQTDPPFIIIDGNRNQEEIIEEVSKYILRGLN
jgi:dTMP kinase